MVLCPSKRRVPVSASLVCAAAPGYVRVLEGRRSKTRDGWPREASSPRSVPLSPFPGVSSVEQYERRTSLAFAVSDSVVGAETHHRPPPILPRQVSITLISFPFVPSAILFMLPAEKWKQREPGLSCGHAAPPTPHRSFLSFSFFLLPFSAGRGSRRRRRRRRPSGCREKGGGRGRLHVGRRDKRKRAKRSGGGWSVWREGRWAPVFCPDGDSPSKRRRKRVGTGMRGCPTATADLGPAPALTEIGPGLALTSYYSSTHRLVSGLGSALTR